MKINHALLLISALLFCSCQKALETPEATEATADKPYNVVLITIDDLNDWTGFLQGHPQALTPNLDAFAENSLSFTNAHCQAPVCGPSRTSMLSGKYPHETGVYGHIHDADLKKEETLTNQVFLPEAFKNKGYKTLAVGKIFHVAEGNYQFDEFGGIFERMGPKPTERIKYDPEVVVGIPGTQTDWGAYPENDEQMPDYKVAQWAQQKISEDHKDPFLLCVGFLRPHVPWYVPQKWLDPFDPELVTPPAINENDFDDISSYAQTLHAVPPMPPYEWMKQKNRIKEATAAYLGAVYFVDAQVGKVLKAIEESPYADNTIVIITSDHGYHLGEKLRWAKFSLWERSTRVPLLVNIPNLKPGKNDAPVGLIDIYPTLADICNLDSAKDLSGMSMVELLNGNESSWREAVSTTYSRGNIALRSKTHRYIKYVTGDEELYDSINDPNEWKNIANEEGSKKVIAAFRAQLPKSYSHWSPYSILNINATFKEEMSESRKITGEKETTAGIEAPAPY